MYGRLEKDTGKTNLTTNTMQDRLIGYHIKVHRKGVEPHRYTKYVATECPEEFAHLLSDKKICKEQVREALDRFFDTWSYPFDTPKVVIRFEPLFEDKDMILDSTAGQGIRIRIADDLTFFFMSSNGKRQRELEGKIVEAMMKAGISFDGKNLGYIKRVNLEYKPKDIIN